MTYYMLLSAVALICRGIVSLLIILNFNEIRRVCADIFGDQDNVADYMAVQFLVILTIFLCLEVLLSMISLIQSSHSKEEYASKMRKFFYIKELQQKGTKFLIENKFFAMKWQLNHFNEINYIHYFYCFFELLQLFFNSYTTVSLFPFEVCNLTVLLFLNLLVKVSSILSWFISISRKS